MYQGGTWVMGSEAERTENGTVVPLGGGVLDGCGNPVLFDS